MAVYVDNVRIKHLGRLWCHLVADSLVELHTFAKLLALPKHAFHRDASYPHYDITIEIREAAISLGAIMGTRQQIIRCAKQLKAELASSSTYEGLLTNPSMKITP